jgi:lipoprotein signal peptidase
MKTFNYIILILLIIGIIIITREITVRTFKCPNTDKTFLIPEEPELTFTQNFISLFNQPSPWIGMRQVEYIDKKEVDFSLMD